MNRAFLELSGYSNDEVIGHPAWDILKPFDTKVVRGGRGGWVKVHTHCEIFCLGQWAQGGSEERSRVGWSVHGKKKIWFCSETTLETDSSQRVSRVSDDDEPELSSINYVCTELLFIFGLSYHPIFARPLTR